MDHICPKDIFWFCVKLNPSIKADFPSVQLKDISSLRAEKDLLTLAAEKLVSDVGLIRHKICYLPEKICSILLFKAIYDGRILSVVELIKCCPYKEFKIPIPTILKNYPVNKKQFAKDELKKHYDISVSIFSTFLNDIVGQKSSSSRLKVLDLGSAPVCCGWLINRLLYFIKVHQEKCMQESRGSNYRKLNPKDIKSVKEIGRKASRTFEKVPRNPNTSEEYVLKCSVRVEHNRHLTEIKECLAKLKSTNLKVIFSGVFFLNVFCQRKEVQALIENVNQDSKLLSIMFSDFHPRLESLLDLMGKFRYLKYLNISKLRPESQALIPEIFVSISKLTSLKRLVLRDIKLTGHLSLLCCGFCQQESDTVIARHCCLAHCGSLKYLDVSGCSLHYRDLKFFEQLSYSKSLKYLDICDNFLPLQSTCQTLLLLSSSLSVLHMHQCLDEYLEYNSETFPLSAFTQLRVLSIGGMKPTLASLKMLYLELEKINLNVLKFGSEIWGGCHLACLDILIKAMS